MVTVVTTNPNTRVDSGTVTVVKKGTGEVVSQTSYSGGRQVSHSRGGGSTGGLGGATPTVSKPTESLPQIVWNPSTKSWVDLSTHKIMASGEVVSRGTPEGLIRKGIASPFSQERFETPQELERAIAIRESPAFQELYNRALAQGTLASEGFRPFDTTTSESAFYKKGRKEGLSQLDPIVVSAPSKDISKMTEAERRQYAGVIAPIITSQIEPMATERQRVIEGIDWNTIWFKKGYYDPKSLQALGDFAVVGKEGAVRFEGLGLTPTTTQKVTKEYFTGLGAETEKQLGAFAETRRAFFEPEKVIPQLFGSKEKRLESLGQFQYGIETEREPLQIGMKAFGSAGFQLPLAYATGRAFGWGFGRAEVMAKEVSLIGRAVTSPIAKKVMVGALVTDIGIQSYGTWSNKKLTTGEKIGESALLGASLFAGFKGFEAGYKPQVAKLYTPREITELRPSKSQIATTRQGGVGIKEYYVKLGETEKIRLTAKVPIEETFRMERIKPSKPILPEDVTLESIEFPKKYVRTSTVIAEPRITEQKYITETKTAKDLGLRYLGESKSYRATPQMIETMGEFRISEGQKLPPFEIYKTEKLFGQDVKYGRSITGAKASLGKGIVVSKISGKTVAVSIFPKLTTVGFRGGKGFTVAEKTYTLFRTPEGKVGNVMTPKETTWFRPMKKLARPKTPIPYERKVLPQDPFSDLRTVLRSRKAQLSLTGQMQKERMDVFSKEQERVTRSIKTRERIITREKVITRPELQVAQRESLLSLKYAPKTAFRGLTVPRVSLFTRTTTARSVTRTTGRLSIGQRTVTRSKLDTMGKLDVKLDLGLKLDTATRTTTKLTTLTRTTPKTPMITPPIISPIIVPPPVIPTIPFGFGAGVTGRMKGFAPRYKRKAGYTATLFSAFTGYRAKISKGAGAKTYTGMEVRPMELYKTPRKKRKR